MLFRFARYRIDPGWCDLRDDERAEHKEAFASVLDDARDVLVRAYALAGPQREAQIMFWETADDERSLEALRSDLDHTRLGRWLTLVHSPVATTEPPVPDTRYGYRLDTLATSAAPRRDSYVAVYPATHPQEAPSPDSQRRARAQRAAVANLYPGTAVHVGYGLGMDGRVRIVAFETDPLGELLEIVATLREGTATVAGCGTRPTCIGVALTIDGALDRLDAPRTTQPREVAIRASFDATA